MILGHNEIVHVVISACLKICRVETRLNGELHLLLQTSFVTCDCIVMKNIHVEWCSDHIASNCCSLKHFVFDGG